MIPRRGTRVALNTPGVTLNHICVPGGDLTMLTASRVAEPSPASTWAAARGAPNRPTATGNTNTAAAVVANSVLLVVVRGFATGWLMMTSMRFFRLAPDTPA